MPAHLANSTIMNHSDDDIALQWLKIKLKKTMEILLKENLFTFKYLSVKKILSYWII